MKGLWYQVATKEHLNVLSTPNANEAIEMSLKHEGSTVFITDKETRQRWIFKIYPS